MKIIESAFDTINKIKNNKKYLYEIKKWIKFGTQNIRLLNKVLRINQDLTVGDKNKIINTLGILKALNRKLKQLQKTGSGIGINENKKSNRIKWEDLESAFENRVRTAVIINLKHKDLFSFLEDSKTLIKSRLTL